jgi:hypothetical protein
MNDRRIARVTGNACYALAFVVAALGLGLLRRRRKRPGRTGAVAVGLVAAGAVPAVVAHVAQALLFDGDRAAMPADFLPAVAAVVAGLLLLMVAVIRTRVVPLWVWALAGATLLLVPFGNQENTTVLLDIPFGLAVALAGTLVLRDATASTSARSRGSRAPV